MADKKQFLLGKIKENLFEFFAKDIESARDSELYIALAKTLRMLIGKNWYKSIQEVKKNKTLYILSFEYSLGTRLVSNAYKLDVYDEIVEIFNDYGKDLNAICEQELESALGFGDLGLISSGMLEALTNISENFHAYGLRYRKGMLKQEIVDFAQVEKPDDWNDYKNPWEHEKGFFHIIELKDYSLKAIPYDVPIVGNKNDYINTLRLWKSESVTDIDFKLFSEGKIQESYFEINRANSVVEFIYPQEDTFEGRKLRLSQEYFFATASIIDILKKFDKYHSDKIEDFPSKAIIQINDVHPILSQVVFIDLIIKKYGIDFKKAVDICKNSFVFFNSSLIAESFEKWDLSLINQVCPQLVPIIIDLDDLLRSELKKTQLSFVSEDSLNIIRSSYVEMINIAFYLSKRVYVPTKQHAKILEYVYLPHHYEYYKDKLELLYIGFNSMDYIEQTNNPMFRAIKDGRLDLDKPDEITDACVDLLFNLKQERKRELLLYLGDKAKDININSVFDMNLGVFHEYKRQLLHALSIALTYYKLKQNSNLDITPRTYFFGGKSYPNYYFAKEIIKFINALAKLINEDFTIKDKIKIFFVEDYNVKKSNMLIPAADINESLPVITMGTMNLETLKFMINGAITVTADLGIIQEYKNEQGDDSIFIFGPDEDQAIDRAISHKYYALDQLNQNPIIRQMFDYFKYLPRKYFPYDFNIILDNLLRYNDGYFVIKDLLSHSEVHERAMRLYRDKKEWARMRLKHISFAKNHEMNEATRNNILNYWR